MNYQHLTKEEATAFFAELYYGEHHIPGYKVHEWGDGWMVKCNRSWSTFDFNNLTRFVIMCHDLCIRGEIRPHAFGLMKIIIHKRQGREGGFTARHPTIEFAIEDLRAIQAANPPSVVIAHQEAGVTIIQQAK